LWSAAIIAGIPEDLFWRSTPQELDALFERRREKDREAYLRVGLIAATIINVNRRKGAPMVQPGDFFLEKPREEDYMDVAEGQKAIEAWAATTNASLSQQVEGLEGNTL
jgi:hypothetical protein